MEKMAAINLSLIPRELLEKAYKEIQQGKKKKRGA